MESAREKGVELHETIHHGRRIQWLRAIGNYIITSEIPTPRSHIFLCDAASAQRARVHSCVQCGKKKIGQIIMSSRDNKMVRRQNGADLNASNARNNHIKGAAHVRIVARTIQREGFCAHRKNPSCYKCMPIVRILLRDAFLKMGG